MSDESRQGPGDTTPEEGNTEDTPTPPPFAPPPPQDPPYPQTGGTSYESAPPPPPSAQWPSGQQYPQGQQYPTASSQPMNPSDEKLWAVLVHLSPFVVSILGPLVIYLVLKDRGPFIAHHAREALNFQLTVLVAAIISAILILAIIGIFMLIAVGIAAFVLQIIAAIKANEGEWYRYPMTIRLIN